MTFAVNSVISTLLITLFGAEISIIDVLFASKTDISTLIGNNTTRYLLYNKIK